MTSELYSQDICAVFKSEVGFMAKHRELFGHFENGGQSGDLHDSKFI